VHGSHFDTREPSVDPKQQRVAVDLQRVRVRVPVARRSRLAAQRNKSDTATEDDFAPGYRAERTHG
jgi:hypothetical protein